ncbi:HET-domain-containing protein, partial [Polyplosphaeria fusca]
MTDLSTDISEISICHALSSNTSDALHLLLEQYHNCCASHAQCSTLESPQPDQYPMRLLDVGSEGSLVILRSARMLRNQDYVCLSHCWGLSKPYTLNSITQPDLERGIDAANLPKTFQDAIHVTRCLGIQYLWIDSLCILQDSEADWAIESGRMDQIYARATCTIAATASSSGDGGLFFERNPEPLLPRKAPLNSRAWVSQERQLSRRTMHFSNRQLFWECHENTTCETYPHDGSTVSLLSELGLTTGIYWAWCSFRVKYSENALTRESDKFVALRGIANQVSEITGDKLIAGLWKSRIVEELCWFTVKRKFRTVNPPTGPEEWRAPTWSWASSYGKVWF